MSKLKILEVTTLFPRWQGDWRGPIIWQIACALQRKGVDVTVISMHGPGSPREEVVDGVRILRPRYMWPTRYEVLQGTGGGLPAAWEKRPWTRLLFPLLLISQTIAILRHARDVDLIHAQFTIPAMAASLGKPLHKKPIVATVRGSDIYRIPMIPGGKLFNQIALGGCEKITVMSRDLSLATQKQIGVPAEKIEYLPPPINMERFWPIPWQNRKPLLVYTASLIPRKGPIYLIEAFAEVLKSFPDYRLVMVGRGPEEERLKQAALANGSYEKIEFISELNQEDLAQLLRQAQLFVLPSLEEALGMVAVEAMASGTPVVGSNVGGIPEVVQPDTGALVPPGDSKALADAICVLLKDQSELQEMGSKARQWVLENFYTHDQNAEHLVRIFNDILNRRLHVT